VAGRSSRMDPPNAIHSYVQAGYRGAVVVRQDLHLRESIPAPYVQYFYLLGSKPYHAR
jgi:hypothetical protein